MELHFVVNPIAKNGYAYYIWSKIKIYLTEQNIPFQYYITKNQGDAERYVADMLQRTKKKIFLVAVGGDGTVHEVVNGSHSFENAIIGCIPAGSGNDFSRGLLLPKSPKKALQLILNKMKKNLPIKHIDLGKYGTNIQKLVFVNNLGC